MAAWGARDAGGGRWWAIGLVAVLAAVVVVLAVIAVQHTQPTRDAGADPGRVTADPDATATPDVTPTPTPSPTVAVLARADERMLVGNGAVLWRATAGECGGATPVVERSADSGATWTAVTPTYRGLAQVQTLDTLADTQAQLVGGVGTACETQLLRTFTQGQFWEPHVPSLGNARYPSLTSRASIVTPDGTIDAPCADPRSVRSADDTLALLCAGVPQRLDGTAWTALDTSGVVALAVDGGDVVTARVAAGCTGVELARTSAAGAATVLGCASDAAATTPLAIAVVDGEVVLWSGTTVVPFPA